MLVRVTTNYGHVDGGRVILKTPTDDPFSIDCDKGRELVARGIAVEVDGDAAEEEVTAADKSVNYTAKTRAELLAIAEERGIKVPARASKADILAALEAEGAR